MKTTMAKLPGDRGVLRALFGPPRAERAPRPDAAEVRARLEGLAAAARTRDYFEVLGVPRSCSGEEARRAADALAAAIERDLASAAADPSLAPLLADVRQVGRDARDVLGDDALRTAYRQGLEPGASSLEPGASSEVANPTPKS